MPARSYIAIDLKSFYASVECMERGLDPLTTHLVVADPSRTEKTICLAVSPSLKAHAFRVEHAILRSSRKYMQPMLCADRKLHGGDLQVNPQMLLS